MTLQLDENFTHRCAYTRVVCGTFYLNLPALEGIPTHPVRAHTHMRTYCVFPKRSHLLLQFLMFAVTCHIFWWRCNVINHVSVCVVCFTGQFVRLGMGRPGNPTFPHHVRTLCHILLGVLYLLFPWRVSGCLPAPLVSLTTIKQLIFLLQAR